MRLSSPTLHKCFAASETRPTCPPFASSAEIAKIGQGLVSVCGLVSQGQGPSQARVGIYSVNRPEWTKCLLVNTPTP